jgi:hypothetical protein
VHLQGFAAQYTEDLGLAAKKGYHPEPSSRPEFFKLMRLYQRTGLHQFRAQRSYETVPREVNDFARGMERLQSGRLAKWISDTTSRNLCARGASLVDAESEEHTGDRSDPDSDMQAAASPVSTCTASFSLSF